MSQHSIVNSSVLAMILATILACSIPDAIQDNMNVGTYYYPWWGLFRHWPEGYLGKPQLGEYCSRDMCTINAHFRLMIEHGIDFIMVSWWGPDSWEDITLRDYLMKSPLAGRIRLAVFYESRGLLSVGVDGNIDFDDQSNVQKFNRDFEYLADTYFADPAYFRVGSRPVVGIYLSRTFIGDYASAISMVRSIASARGFDLYLIGDQVYWQLPSEQREVDMMQQLDAVTPYNMHASTGDIDVDFVQKVSSHYAIWYSAAQSNGCAFIPNIMPGFDDSAVRPQASNPTIERTPSKFEFFCTEAVKYLAEQNMILITSWNEWHEYTQIEPDRNYGETYLDIVASWLAGYR